MFIELSSKSHMAFVQIANCDWLPGRRKWLFLEKCYKNLLLWLYLTNSQVSVYRTIGPLVIIFCYFFNSLLYKFSSDFVFHISLMLHFWKILDEPKRTVKTETYN